MTWPTANISLANVDAASDSISNARADIYDAFSKVNLMINNGAGGELVIDTTPQLGGNLDVLGQQIYSSTQSYVAFNSNVAVLNSNYFYLDRYREAVFSAGNTSTGITPTYANGPVQKYTANGSFTLDVPTSMITGNSLVLIITQDATGSRVMTADASLKFAGGSKTLSTAGASIDVITIFYDGTNYLCNLSKAYS